MLNNTINLHDLSKENFSTLDLILFLNTFNSHKSAHHRSAPTMRIYWQSINIIYDRALQLDALAIKYVASNKTMFKAKLATTANRPSAIDQVKFALKQDHIKLNQLKTEIKEKELILNNLIAHKPI